MMLQTASRLSTTGALTRLRQLGERERSVLPAVFGAFLDVAAADLARATFYNTREEQVAAAIAAHDALFAIDRGVYAVALALPGVTDRTRQLGVGRLVSTAFSESLLSADVERSVVTRLIADMPPQRVLKIFLDLRAERCNNARTRKLILRYVLGSRAFELWAVKYRRKLAACLRHAWGCRRASVIRAVLSKKESDRNSREAQLVARELGRFVPGEGDRHATVQECVRFVLGDESNLTLPRLQAYREAREDLDRGRRLPYEVLEGFRGRLHKERTSAEVLELARGQLTAGQRIALQRKAEDASVEVAFDPRDYDAVRLYINAFERGLSDEIRNELERKAKAAAERLPLRFDRVAVVVDASASMLGDETQRRRPIAVALALRDMLVCASEEAEVFTADFRPAPSAALIEPQGDTSLAGAIVAALRCEPEAVFVVSDGYENAPAGRSAEVVRAARRFGVATPVFQISPVLAAESGGVRRLGDDVATIAVHRVESVVLGLLKTAFAIDVERGVEALAAFVAPALAAPNESSQRIGVER